MPNYLDPSSITNAAGPAAQPSTSERILDFLAALGQNSPEFARSLRYVQQQLAENRIRGQASASTLGYQLGQVPEQVTEERGYGGQLLQSLGILGQPEPRPITAAERQAAVYGITQRVKQEELLRRGDIGQEMVNIRAGDLAERDAMRRDALEERRASREQLGQYRAGELELRGEALGLQQSALEEKKASREQLDQYRAGELKLGSERLGVEREKIQSEGELRKLMLRMREHAAKADRLIKIRTQKISQFTADSKPLADSLKEMIKGISSRGGHPTKEEVATMNHITDQLNTVRQNYGLTAIPLHALIALQDEEGGAGGFHLIDKLGSIWGGVKKGAMGEEPTNLPSLPER